jgi:shikimate dehydrogenase
VLGSPIGHSLSPVLHRAAYDALGLDWSYDAYDVREETLGDFVAGLPSEYRGLSVTMPLKSAVIPLCTSVTETARLVGSVNTVLLEPDGSRAGDNTDVPGMVAALAEFGMTDATSAVIVGAGSTAASALAAMARLGASHVVVLARTPEKAARLMSIGATVGAEVVVEPLGAARQVASADVLVSTIPAEAQASDAGPLAGVAPVVLDVIYHPSRTPLLAAVAEAGGTAVPGMALLLHQAARQVELMTGCAAPLEAMRAAGLTSLD